MVPGVKTKKKLNTIHVIRSIRKTMYRKCQNSGMIIARAAASIHSTPLSSLRGAWADAGREEGGERLCASGDARSEENLKER
jgi:hypothetical protein